MEKLIRLQKAIASTGYCSRRKAEEMIQEGRVSIDGVTCSKLGTKVDPSSTKIRVDGEILSFKHVKFNKYYVLNKPTGIITSSSRKEGFKTIYDFFDNKDPRIKSVGRLDVNTEGLLLMTTDGELIYRLTHPKFGVRRKYLVRAKGIIPKLRFEQVAQNGITIEEEGKPAVKVKNIGFMNLRYTDSYSWFEIEVGEGRNREIRKIVEKMGGIVSRLKRIVYGTVYKNIPPKGQYRELTEEEINSLYKLVKLKRSSF